MNDHAKNKLIQCEYPQAHNVYVVFVTNGISTPMSSFTMSNMSMTVSTCDTIMCDRVYCAV